ncbi:uncharacterized protein BDR25DRAFT_350190 [Lindgomyces ingoldianus]|uniref:Uncharacterized protein n=1 Tax=Lindgomyces ingoldianus TaxID=673940 RepID=A0ACB6R9Z2_9PLEO|nr:uncharacterized protein BDR25DRAFT_350190 [Lindgomyces ingoldianus]KAF2475907.1 hypothetical protein BDR25DRAFT_350190 [Lindgomyces ingoldianus]
MALVSYVIYANFAARYLFQPCYSSLLNFRRHPQEYILSVIIEGTGLTPQNSFHWSLAFYQPSSNLANTCQALLLSPTHLIYPFDRRDGVLFPLPGADVIVKLAELSQLQYLMELLGKNRRR